MHSNGNKTGKTSPTVMFPRLKTQNLNGDDLAIPDELPGDPTLILVSFWRHHQADVAAWLPVIDELKRQFPHLDSVELRALPRNSHWVQMWIRRGMADEISPAGRRARVACAWVDMPDFLQSLELTVDDELAVMAVHDNGSIAYQARGRPTAESVGGLKTLLGAERPDP